MPNRWLPVAAVTTPITSGAAKAVALPEKEKKPKNSVVFSAGESRASSVRLEDWIGTGGKPDENGEGEIDLLADGSERRAPRKLRLDRLREQHVVLVDRQDADRSKDEDEERRGDHGLRPEPVVEDAAERRADGAGNGEDDAERPSSAAPQPNTLAA